MPCADCAALALRVSALELDVSALKAAQSAGAAPVGIASDRELDDPKHGDPSVRKDPPRWKGQSFVGVVFSRCSPEFLDELAGFKDWCAEKEDAIPEKKKYAAYSRYDARRARGWAARLRAGWKPPKDPYAGRGYVPKDPAAAPADGAWSEADDEIPF